MESVLAKNKALDPNGIQSEIASNCFEIFAADKGITKSNQFAILAKPFCSELTSSKKIAHPGLTSCGIDLPGPTVEADNSGLRISTREVIRSGMIDKGLPHLADFIVRALAYLE